MSAVPRSLCAVDGSLYIPADKASLIHATEGAKAQTVPSVTQNDATQTQPPKVLIIDAMAALHSITKTSTIGPATGSLGRRTALQQGRCCPKCAGDDVDDVGTDNNVSRPRVLLRFLLATI